MKRLGSRAYTSGHTPPARHQFPGTLPRPLLPHRDALDAWPAGPMRGATPSQHSKLTDLPRLAELPRRGPQLQTGDAARAQNTRKGSEVQQNSYHRERPPLPGLTAPDLLCDRHKPMTPVAHAPAELEPALKAGVRGARRLGKALASRGIWVGLRDGLRDRRHVPHSTDRSTTRR